MIRVNNNTQRDTHDLWQDLLPLLRTAGINITRIEAITLDPHRTIVYGIECVLFETEDKSFRILELIDENADMANLKGDCFDFEKSGYTGTQEELEKEERDFEALVNCEGVFGYVLEKWNPLPGEGYEHVDSCWGFVGRFQPSGRSDVFNHYIVDEMKGTIRKQGGEA